MNVKQKYKEIDEKLNSISTDKYFWLFPVFEVLIILPIFMIWLDNQHLFLHNDYNYICAPGQILFELAITKNSVVLIVLGFATLATKIVSAFFMMKKAESGYVATIILYLIDFIVAVVSLFTCETSLQEWSIKHLKFLVVSISVAPCISCVYFWSYFRLIKKKKWSKEARVYNLVIFSLLFVALGFSWADGNKKVATESEVETLNRCYEYSEKYLYEKLPEDKETLEKMQSDIEEVFNKELFFTAFNQSEYFERLKEEQKTDINSPIEMKSEYANELMYLKSKILLKLDKNEEYVDYYIETRQYFSHVKVYIFSEHLANDKANFSDEDYDTIKKGCFTFLESDALEHEKYLCLTDLGFVNSQFMTDDERVKLGKEIREKYIPGYTKEMFKADLAEWETLERALYMLK